MKPASAYGRQNNMNTRYNIKPVGKNIVLNKPISYICRITGNMAKLNYIIKK